MKLASVKKEIRLDLKLNALQQVSFIPFWMKISLKVALQEISRQIVKNDDQHVQLLVDPRKDLLMMKIFSKWKKNLILMRMP